MKKSEHCRQNHRVTPSEVVLEFLSWLKIQWNFRHCLLFRNCHKIIEFFSLQSNSHRNKDCFIFNFSLLQRLTNRK